MANWGKRVNFGNGNVEILTKSRREETQVMWWEDLNFGIPIAEILAARICCLAAKWSARMRSGWKETNCGNQVVEILGEWGERK